MIKIDKAVFRQVGDKQTYSCALYKDGDIVGGAGDVRGLFFDDFKEYLETKYPGIKVTVE
jgi:hypothetical protein